MWRPIPGSSTGISAKDIDLLSLNLDGGTRTVGVLSKTSDMFVWYVKEGSSVFVSLYKRCLVIFYCLVRFFQLIFVTVCLIYLV